MQKDTKEDVALLKYTQTRDAVPALKLFSDYKPCSPVPFRSKHLLL